MSLRRVTRCAVGRRPLPLPLALLAALLAVPAARACPNLCSGHGNCDPVTLACQCFAEYGGADCSQLVCPTGYSFATASTATDNMHSLLVECSGVGVCDSTTGTCNCQPGFEGRACERMYCWRRCSGHGRCLSMSQAAQQEDDIALFYTNTYTLWDADTVFGCACDISYTGYDCSLRQCIAGDDPLTTGQAAEKQVLHCQCVGCAGSFVLSFRGVTTPPIAHNAVAMAADEDLTSTTLGTGRGESLQSKLQALRTITLVGVAISGTGSVCQSASASTVEITFRIPSGNVPPVVLTSALTATGTLSVSVTADGTGGSVVGTTESELCNNRGDCDYGSGLCFCFPGYGPSNGQGGSGSFSDCGYATGISGCPHSVCNGHGVCSGATSYRCTCYAGWSGGSCNFRDCPLGAAWFDEATGDNVAHAPAVCSNAGVCDRATGACVCRAWFEGAACERSSCPSAVPYAACSGHGRCMSVAAVTAAATVNGVPPGNLEVQTVTCTAGSGTVAFGWQYATTVPISYAASLATVRAALATLPPLRGVSVSFGGGATTLCSAAGGGTVLSITFTQNLGPQVLITATTAPSASLAGVARTVTGSLPSYGQTAGTAATWDANKRFACVCDMDLGRNRSRVSGGDLAPYVGADCSLRSCVLGRDPRSAVLPLSEKQSVTCTASSGSLTLSFRGESTAAIPVAAAAADIVAALEAVVTVGTVLVTFTSGTTACHAAGGSTFVVDFRSELGNLPPLVAAASAGTVSVGEPQAGTHVLQECSGRGACVRSSGICSCFLGYASSDGFGKMGTRGDCGYIDPLYMSSTYHV